tara:strand:- start:813 stop:953 length:141 start_codon:yes stop_codon:yes gene_type:complete
MALAGFEPATYCLEGSRSIQAELQSHNSPNLILFLKIANKKINKLK